MWTSPHRVALIGSLVIFAFAWWWRWPGAAWFVTTAAILVFCAAAASDYDDGGTLAQTLAAAFRRLAFVCRTELRATFRAATRRLTPTQRRALARCADRIARNRAWQWLLKKTGVVVASGAAIRVDRRKRCGATLVVVTDAATELCDATDLSLLKRVWRPQKWLGARAAACDILYADAKRVVYAEHVGSQEPPVPEIHFSSVVGGGNAYSRNSRVSPAQTGAFDCLVNVVDLERGTHADLRLPGMTEMQALYEGAPGEYVALGYNSDRVRSCMLVHSERFPLAASDARRHIRVRMPRDSSATFDTQRSSPADADTASTPATSVYLRPLGDWDPFPWRAPTRAPAFVRRDDGGWIARGDDGGGGDDDDDDDEETSAEERELGGHYEWRDIPAPRSTTTSTSPPPKPVWRPVRTVDCGAGRDGDGGESGADTLEREFKARNSDDGEAGVGWRWNRGRRVVWRIGDTPLCRIVEYSNEVVPNDRGVYAYRVAGASVREMVDVLAADYFGGRGRVDGVAQIIAGYCADDDDDDDGDDADGRS
jgi:hypothetical protein